MTSASPRPYTRGGGEGGRGGQVGNCGSGRTQDCDRAGTSEASSNSRSVISLAAACVQDNASFSK